MLVAISGLRASSVGVDNYEYSEWFASLSLDNSLVDSISLNIIDYEPGFVIINYILKVFDFGYNWALVLYALLIWVPIYLFSKYFKNFYFVIFSFVSLGFLFFTFNGQRQAIAIGFIFLGTFFLLKHNYILFALSILIATMYHFSAILMGVIFFIFRMPRFSVKYWFFSILFSLFIPLSVLFGLIEKIASLFPFYGSYIQNDNFKQANIISGGVLYQVLLEFIILYYYKLYAKTSIELKFFNVFFVGAIGFNLFYGNLFLSRIVVYLLFFQPFVLAIILSKLKSTSKYLEVLSILSLLFLMFIYKILFSDSGCSPYILAS